MPGQGVPWQAVTWLYVPGDRPERFGKALAGGADVVIVDLEDAVLPPAKATARENVVRLLTTLANRDHTPGGIDGPAPNPAGGATSGPTAGRMGGPASGPTAGRMGGPAGGPVTGPVGGPAGGMVSGPQVHVRINHPRGAHGAADLAALAALAAGAMGPHAVRVPKVEGPGDVDLVRDRLGPAAPPLYCLIESALGVENAARVAARPGVGGVALGEADLAAELGVRGEAAFAWIRSRLVVAAAAAGLPAPAMAVYTDIRDDEGLLASCLAGRDLGLFGRTAIHPRQLPVIRRAFTPTAAEVARARAIVSAARAGAADGSGAIALPDGGFVDAPVLASARRTLVLAERLGV
jgi:citrate lyase subunit beta/citryl-CoA lyase